MREEERFRQTLKAGTNILSVELEKLPADAALPGAVAFLLHDTHGFPLELTQEIASERGVEVDNDGFRGRDGRAEAARQGSAQARRCG